MKLMIRSIVIVIIVCLLVLLFITLAGCSSLSGEKGLSSELERMEPADKLVSIIEEEMHKKKITGISIAVANSEGLIWTEGLGLADKKEKTAFTDTTISNVGSVSKLVTAAAVMRLVERGQVDLDEPVATYIPEFNPEGMENFTTPITVRMLLNHESGLESDAFHGFFLGYEMPEDFPYTYRRAIAAVNTSGIVREPYEIFSYCNLGYSLLGVIVERAMGMSFQDATAELVFEPLGMVDSSFNIDDIPEGRMARGYLQGKPEKLPFIRDMPAGSLNSTAVDMGRFLQSMLRSYRLDEGLLSQQTVKQMFEPSNEQVLKDLDFQIGLTWWIVDLQKLPGEFIIGHGGDLPPYHALVIMLPEKDISVFAMVNSIEGVGSFSLTEIVTEAVKTFLEAEEVSAAPEQSAKSPVTEIPEALRETLKGYYASPVGLSEIKVSRDKLKMYTFGRWFDVYYHENGTLTLGYKLLGMFPLKMPVFDEISISLEALDGRPAVNLRVQDILLSPAVKIEPKPIDPAWVSRIGKYASSEEELMPQYTDFRIDEDKDSGLLCLYLKSSGEWSRFPLETLDASSARIMGAGRSLGGIIRYTGDDTITFQNFKLKKQ